MEDESYLTLLHAVNTHTPSFINYNTLQGTPDTDNNTPRYIELVDINTGAKVLVVGLDHVRWAKFQYEFVLEFVTNWIKIETVRGFNPQILLEGVITSGEINNDVCHNIFKQINDVTKHSARTGQLKYLNNMLFERFGSRINLIDMTDTELEAAFRRVMPENSRADIDDVFTRVRSGELDIYQYVQCSKYIQDWVIISARNTRAVIKTFEHTSRGSSCILLYGLDHLDDLEKQLTNEFEYRHAYSGQTMKAFLLQNLILNILQNHSVKSNRK